MQWYDPNDPEEIEERRREKEEEARREKEEAEKKKRDEELISKYVYTGKFYICPQCHELATHLWVDWQNRILCSRCQEEEWHHCDDE